MVSTQPTATDNYRQDPKSWRYGKAVHAEREREKLEKLSANRSKLPYRDSMSRRSYCRLWSIRDCSMRVGAY